MPLKSLHPIKFEPIWAEYETWGWEKQGEWSLDNSRSACLRKMFIEEQLEFAKEKRQAKANRAEIEEVIMEMVAAGVIRAGK